MALIESATTYPTGSGGGGGGCQQRWRMTANKSRETGSPAEAQAEMSYAKTSDKVTMCKNTRR